MPSKNWTNITIGLFTVIILGTSILTGQSIDQNGLKWVSGASSTVIVLLLIFDRWAWRWPLIRSISEHLGHRVIHGTWKGKIEFDKDSNRKPGKVDCFLSIHQTFSTVEIRGYFSTSNSYSITATIDKPRSTHTRLVYVYHGEAPFGKRDKNRPNNGTAFLDIIGKPVESITGSYFTDRDGGTGRIKLSKHSKKLSESFEQATKQKFTKLN